jgi:diguanylate cyclase
MKVRNYQENYIDSKKLADRVLEETAKRHIRPNPINFTVWYEYLLERDPHIREMMLHVSDHEQESVAFDLFNHIVNRICFMTEIENVVLKLVNEIIGDIDGWEGNLDSHAVVLEHSLGLLVGKTSDPATAATIVKEVITCVKELTLGAESIKHKMEDVRSEVDNLKKQLEMSYREAHSDALTGLANRRAMDKFIVETLSNSEKKQEDSLSCIILDIDFFKKINDKYGHLVGDSVLRFIAKMLKRLTKGQDLVARFGGEEFIILLPHTICRDAYLLANKLREKLQQSTLVIRESNEPLKVTASFGIATHRFGEPTDDFIARADKALYLAKQSGRNCVKGELDLLASII